MVNMGLARKISHTAKCAPELGRISAVMSTFTPSSHTVWPISALMTALFLVRLVTTGPVRVIS